MPGSIQLLEVSEDMGLKILFLDRLDGLSPNEVLVYLETFSLGCIGVVLGPIPK